MESPALKKTVATVFGSYLGLMLLDALKTVTRLNVENWATENGLAKVYKSVAFTYLRDAISFVWDAVTGGWGLGFACGFAAYAFWEMRAASRRVTEQPSHNTSESVSAEGQAKIHALERKLEGERANREILAAAGRARDDLPVVMELLARGKAIAEFAPMPIKPTALTRPRNLYREQSDFVQRVQMFAEMTLKDVERYREFSKSEKQNALDDIAEANEIDVYGSHEGKSRFNAMKRAVKFSMEYLDDVRKRLESDTNRARGL